MYLQKMDLMQITTAGRAITKAGKDYLESLDEIQEKQEEMVAAAKEERKPVKPIKIKLPAGMVTELPDGFIPKKN
jgi:hypothetical protein